jgi:hypothetical protein
MGSRRWRRDQEQRKKVEKFGHNKAEWESMNVPTRSPPFLPTHVMLGKASCTVLGVITLCATRITNDK